MICWKYLEMFGSACKLILSGSLNSIAAEVRAFPDSERKACKITH
jgi:hypothetical protein